MKKNNLVAVTILSAMFFGCAAENSPRQMLNADVNQQLASSATACDSSSACSKSFVEALNKFKATGDAEFCDELVQRSDTDLSICEVQIRDSKYSDLIASCKSTIVKRLNSIVAKRNAGLMLQANVTSTEKMGLNFTIPTNVQIRDTSKGYYTIDGGIKEKEVILSFDDGPEPTNTLSVLRTLHETGVKAHFFQLGLRIQESPEVTKMVAAEGHSMGNHSWDHPNMRTISFKEAADQIKRTQSMLLKVLGWADPFFRFPYGNKTDQLSTMLAENQMANFYWSIDTNDWRMVNEDKTPRTNKQVIDDTIKQLDRRGRGMILMHDIHRRTAELLPELLRLIADRGYTAVLLQPANTDLKTNPPILVNSNRIAVAQ